MIITNINALVETKRDLIVKDLVEYASKETPSDDVSALAEGLGWIASWMDSRLGAPAFRERINGHPHGDILVSQYTGTDSVVTALCHYDTVWPLGTLERWPVTIKGDKLSGPGVFDMKAGLVQAVWAIAIAREAGVDIPTVRFVINGDEEIGSPTSRPHLENASVDADAVLVFEASADGAVKTARKGVGIFTVEAFGVEAHAGLDPESGASAIDEIARIVRTLHDAQDLAVGTSINVGVLRGGSRTNVSAGMATAEIDVRVSTDAEIARIDALLAALTPHDSRASLTVSGGWNRPVMHRGDGRLYELAREVAAAIGIDLRETSVGGASDGNFAAALGVPVLDGLGAVGDGAHARHEWISIDGLVERTALAAAILAKLATAK